MGAAAFFVGAGAGAIILAGAGAAVVAGVGATVVVGFEGAAAGEPLGLDAGAVAAKVDTARTAKRMAERAEREADIVAAKCRLVSAMSGGGAAGRAGVACFVLFAPWRLLAAFSAGFEGGECCDI